jgi:hypothetical protein
MMPSLTVHLRRAALAAADLEHQVGGQQRR